MPELMGEGAPSQLAAGYTSGFSLARLATMSYETIGEHTAYQAIIKLADLGALNGSGDLVVHWGEVCGNDWLQVDLPGNAVDAPPTLSLIGLAAFAFAGVALRRRRRAAATATA